MLCSLLTFGLWEDTMLTTYGKKLAQHFVVGYAIGFVMGVVVGALLSPWLVTLVWQ